MDRRLMLMENFSPWGVVCPCPGAIYMYMTKYSNIFFSETARPIKAKLHVEHLGRGNESLYKWSRSHDQDGRHGYK